MAGGRGLQAARKALAVVLSVVLALALGGCRDSDVLTMKITGEVDEYELDETLTPVALENPESSSNMSQEEDESDREDDEDDEAPDYDEDDADTDEETEQNAESDYSKSDGDATSGDGVSDGTSASSVTDGSGHGESDSPRITFDFTGDSDLTGSSDEESTGEESVTDDADGSTTAPSVSSSTGASNEPSGTTVVQPGSAEGYSNMATSQTIAAAGSIATLVAAIGGGEVLAVCNTDWYDDLPSSAFSNKTELEDVVCIDDWGDGTSMEDCYKQIAAALPQDWSAAVLVDENTYESDYDDYFTERCIYVVVLEAYGTVDVSDDWIADDVEVVAELIGTDFAKDQYQAWNELYTEALEATLTANGGYSIYTGSTVPGSGQGGTYDFLYKGVNEPVNSSGTLTNISSNLYWFDYVYAIAEPTTDTVNAVEASDFLCDTRSWHAKLVWPLSSWAALDSSLNSLCYDISDGMALNVPMSNQEKWSSWSEWATMDYYLQYAGAVDKLGRLNFYLRTTDNRVATSSGTISYSTTSLHPYGRTLVLGGFTVYDESAGEFIVAGDEEYPYVLAQSASIAKRIAASAGIADEDSLTVGLYNTGEDYTILVMPSGISGSWTYGTFESFLMAPYFYCWYQQGGDLSACDTYVSDFYSQFYRCGADVLTNTSSSKTYGWYGYSVYAETNLG